MRLDPMAASAFFDISVIFSRVLKTTQVREYPAFTARIVERLSRRSAHQGPVLSPLLQSPSQISQLRAGNPSDAIARPAHAILTQSPGLPFGLRHADPGSMLDR